ncbi:SoxR reducing system RseC family protein [Desulfobotulus sp. H1]|uniref:SoxR reducing system RseC family protein n=1 Tax=Desulfobotulus pelophilus TaxID=2823377 RepID=A0ABT3ND33_9BACT|nr:SoxR reducing system RseC family protein [Desulfobotulus pelophilus]MCW7755376.1 SoxR reducing system RseC family protein [Desulfobotulus pelophilus]
MRTTEAVVTATSPDKTRVRACRPEACSACRAKGICGVDTATMEIQVKTFPGIDTGDRVLVGIGSQEFLRVMALLYITPVFCFVLVALTAHHAASRMQLPADPLAALAAIFSLVPAFFVIRRISHNMAKSPAYGPRILKRLHKSDFPDKEDNPRHAEKSEINVFNIKTKL